MQSHLTLCMQISFGLTFYFFIIIIKDLYLNDLTVNMFNDCKRFTKILIQQRNFFNILMGQLECNSRNCQGSKVINNYKMKQGRGKKVGVKLPLIKQKLNLISSNSINRSLKLQKINRQKHIALVDISKINKIQREYAQITKRKEEHQNTEPKQDEMRQSKLLLLKNIAPETPKKFNQVNRLSNLVQYQPISTKQKGPMINANNISLSPTKQKKPERKQQQQKNITSEYANSSQLQKVDFVKLFIVEELLYYISKTNERVKQEMAGFCKFYNQNTDEDSYALIATVLIRNRDYLNSLFLQKLGFYIFLILGTDADIMQEAHFLLNSLTDYIHTNNLIILDILMEIIDIQKFPVSSQFHVYNTLRFNEDRRKIKHSQDKMSLVAKNNASMMEIIRSIVLNCGFQSLRTFVFEILNNNQSEIFDKVRQVSLMLVSLDSILTSSIHQNAAKPKPPFLPPLEKGSKYTLVLDMDQTLIHTKQFQNSKSIFLVRPYCQEFLDEVSKYYEVVIFTAAVKQYADNILNSIDQKKRISHRLYRQHTRIEDFVSIKDLSMIGRELNRSIIIDNIASNFKMQPRNGIAISTWTGEPDDISLLNLIPVLKKLVIDGVQDVRDGLEKLSQFMQMRLSKGQEIVFEQISLKGL